MAILLEKDWNKCLKYNLWCYLFTLMKSNIMCYKFLIGVNVAQFLLSVIPY